MSLRIISPNAPESVRAEAVRSSNAVDNYMDRLVKLVPAEAIAAFPLLVSLASQEGLWAKILVSWLLLVISIVLRWHATASGARGAQRTAVFVAAVSFVIWVYVMDGTFGITLGFRSLGFEQIADSLSGAKQFLSVLFLVIWTMLVPVFYTGDSE